MGCTTGHVQPITAQIERHFLDIYTLAVLLLKHHLLLKQWGCECSLLLKFFVIFSSKLG